MISIFVANLNGGGAERMMLNLAKGFADKNINTELVLSSAVGPFLNEVPDNVKKNSRLEITQSFVCYLQTTKIFE